MANPCTVTLTEGKLTALASRQLALYETVPVAVTGLTWTAGHTYAAGLWLGATQMGGVAGASIVETGTGVLTWTFSLPLTHSALIAACVGKGVTVEWGLWDATDLRWVFKDLLFVRYTAEPDGFVASDPVGPSAWPTADSAQALADADWFAVGQLIGAVRTWCRKNGTQLKTWLDAQYVTLAQKGAANGVAPLGADAKVSTTYLPAAVLGTMDYQGTWDAATNTPTIAAASTDNKGWYYVVATAGTTTVDGVSEWAVGDWLVSSGTTWDKLDHTDAVVSVAGLTGAIAAGDLVNACNAIAIADGNIDGGTDDASFMDPVFDIDCGVF